MSRRCAGLPGEAPDLRRDRHLSGQLEEDRSGCHPAGLQGLGRPGRLERRLLPDPEGYHCGGHVSLYCTLLRKAPLVETLEWLPAGVFPDKCAASWMWLRMRLGLKTVRKRNECNWKQKILIWWVTLQLIRLRQERVGAAVSGAAAVQHQRAVQRLRQVLLRPAIAVRVQQPQLPPGAAQQRQGPETRGEIQLHVCAHKTNMTTLGALNPKHVALQRNSAKSVSTTPH